MSSRIIYSTINQRVKDARYAVRGPIALRALELQNEIKNKNSKLPFKQTIFCNIGNPHQLKQKPLSFNRDVLSLLLNPDLKNRCAFPKDVIARARKYSRGIMGLGAYTESQGIPAVREEVAQSLFERDGFKSDPENIFLTNGASDGVRYCMQVFHRSSQSGFSDSVLAPIPQYPLYSAQSTLMGITLSPYYLDESRNWDCSVENVIEGVEAARAKGLCVRSVVIINPGNPTGQIMDPASIKAVIEYCREENICIFADEVYQANIWKTGAKFVSFRKVAHEIDAFSGENPLQLVSFHSISKGFTGECGLRGGYLELLGIPSDVKAEILKLASVSLCPSTIGQISVGLTARPPKPGDESYEVYVSEKTQILQSLQRRANSLSNVLNSIEGITCNPIDGAMYAFPNITLPPKLVAAAKAKDMEPDAFYCMQLLERTGIVVVPGSGFGQKDGTFHFRTTILPPEDKMKKVGAAFAKFHSEFTAEYK